MNAKESIEKLRRAHKLLEEASVLIEDALHMSGITARGKDLLDALEHCSSSRDDAGSIPNIIADIGSVNDDPCWTRPFASVKYFDGKNI